MTKQLSEEMLNLDEKRKYIILVKRYLLGFIVKLANKYPEATKENTHYHNTHVLIDIRDKFFEYEALEQRIPLFKAMWRVFIAEYEHDPWYRHRIEWIIDQIKKSDWTPRVPTRPTSTLWHEPDSSRYDTGENK